MVGAIGFEFWGRRIFNNVESHGGHRKQWETVVSSGNGSQTDVDDSVLDGIQSGNIYDSLFCRRNEDGNRLDRVGVVLKIKLMRAVARAPNRAPAFPSSVPFPNSCVLLVGG